MDPHPIDATAFVGGLFFGLAGLALFANRQWHDVDVTAFTAAGVMLIGLLLAGMIVLRFVNTAAEQDPSATEPPTDEA